MVKLLENGELVLNMHAIKKIVYFAVMESYGPVNIESESFFSKLFAREEEKIKIVEEDDGKIIVDVFIDLEYGVKISEVSRNIIDNVKHKLKELGGITDVTVNVHITNLK